ncbi:MAG: response regulator transcription factor [Chloroflexota bacterium]
MTEEIRILVADDHPLFRQGVVHTLHEDPGLVIVSEAASVAAASEAARETLPDIILLDMQFPDGTGLDVLDSLQEDCPYSRVIILTVVDDEDTLVEALKRGARGYILKGTSGTDLKAIVRAVAAGETYVTPQMAGRLLKELASGRDDNAAGVMDLTDRERSILDLVATGMTNKEIADRLFLSEKTVKHYMTNILQKLHVRNRVEAAMLVSRRKNLP